MPSGIPDPVFEKFSLARRLHKTLGKLEGYPSLETKFWQTHTDLKALLVEISEERFDKLNRNQMLEFFHYCSAYRPVEPFVLLTRISMLYKEEKR